MATDSIWRPSGPSGTGGSRRSYRPHAWPSPVTGPGSDGRSGIRNIDGDAHKSHPAICRDGTMPENVHDINILFLTFIATLCGTTNRMRVHVAALHSCALELLLESDHVVIALVNRSDRIADLRTQVRLVIGRLVLVRDVMCIQTQVAEQFVDPVKMIDLVNK